MAGASTARRFECRLDSAHDLATLLAALQLREKDQKEQRVHCEASARGLKFTAQSNAKDAAVLGWIFHNAFKQYIFAGDADEIHLRLPVAPLLSSLQIFSDRAALTLKYPVGPSGELHFTLEEDGAVTECDLRTLVLDEVPAPMGGFFAPGDPLTVFRPVHPEAWHIALERFSDLDGTDVALSITFRAGSPIAPAAVVLHAQTITSDAEVELPRDVFDDLELAPEVAAAGGVTHRYLLGSVLASCLRAAKDAKAVKVRFNSEGIMSNQFILRGRCQRDIFCEALVSPLAEGVGLPGAHVSKPQSAGGIAASGMSTTSTQPNRFLNGSTGTGVAPAVEESVGF